MSNIYAVTIRGEYYGQNTINVFHYVDIQLLSVPSALDLLTNMGFVGGITDGVFADGTLAQVWQTYVDDAFRFVEAEARNLYSDTDFYVAGYSPALVGQAEGEGLPPFNAYGFRSSRVRLSVRRGFKRLAGVIEENVAPGGELNGGGIAAVTAIASKLSDELSGDGTLAVYQPSVLSFMPYTSAEGKEYRIPYPTVEEQLAHAAVGVEYAPYLTVRSQTSRQYGRGI